MGRLMEFLVKFITYNSYLIFGTGLEWPSWFIARCGVHKYKASSWSLVVVCRAVTFEV